MQRLKLLLLSAGSLLGQNLLDALEGRREHVRVIGANHGADNPRLFRCDTAYLTPPVGDAPAFRARLRELIALEQPDLVLPGRDHDVPFLGELRDAEPALAPRLPCGPKVLADMMQDKWESHLFCQRHDLPFADTLLAGPDGDPAAARAFAARHGFPLIAKPRLGYGTLGVRILFDDRQLAHAARAPGYVLQPYMAPPPDLRENFFDPAEGWPFFFSLVDDGQYAGQAIIAPDGELAAAVWCHRCTMIAGKPEITQPVDEPAFAELTRHYARTVAAAGWHRPFNLQARKLAPDTFAGFEMNGRMTGTTSVRRLYGFDEIGLVARAFAGFELPPALPAVTAAGPGRVFKFITDYYSPAAWVRTLEARGVWHAPAAT